MNANAAVHLRRSNERAQRANGEPETLGLACVLLCGGASRRMGQDKARADLAGRSLIERALEPLRTLGAPVVLATGSDDRYDDLGFPRVHDDPTLAGPAAGLVAALESQGATHVLAVACDMPRLDARVLRELADRARRDDLDACFLRTDAGREPLCAVYGARVAPAMRAAQGRGNRRVLAFLDEDIRPEWRVGDLLANEVSPELRGADCARNLNTPEELREERQHWEGGRR